MSDKRVNEPAYFCQILPEKRHHKQALFLVSLPQSRFFFMSYTNTSKPHAACSIVQTRESCSGRVNGSRGIREMWGNKVIPAGSVSVGEGWGMARLFCLYRRWGHSGSGSRGARWEGDMGEEEGEWGGGGGPHLVKARFRRAAERTLRRHEPGAAGAERLRQSRTRSSSLDTWQQWRAVGRNKNTVCLHGGVGGGGWSTLNPASWAE